MDECPKSTYLSEPEQWRELGKRLLATKEVCGIDSETIGCDPENDTAVDTAKIVVWSVGIPEGRLRPRGYRECEGFVLPVGAVDDPLLREWLTSAKHTKVAHNCRYDRHAFANAGVELGGLVDTVDLYRVIAPGRERYGLKMLVPDVLGWTMLGDFKTLFSEAVIKESTKTRKAYVCVSHGDQDGRRKYCEVCKDEVVVVERTEHVVKELKTRRMVPLQAVCGIGVLEGVGRMEPVPGEHPLWETFVQYAGADAIGAAQLYQARSAQNDGLRKAKVPVL